VISYSSGNHAQAVALAGRLLGIKTVIVMPDNAPRSKRAATEGYGGIVIPYNPAEEDRARIAHEQAAQHGYTVIPPYDHPHVIAGQGTAALELLEDVTDLDALLVPVGGGGLISGCALAANGAAPNCKVIGVEPEVANDAYLSFYSRTLHTVHNPPTIADGTRTPSLGKLTFPLVLQYVSAMRTASEAQIKDAVRLAFSLLKIVVEPSGALGLAGALAAPWQELTGKDRPRVGVLISGGNIDAQVMAEILNGVS
jgi:threonine dehydratase